MLTTIGAPQDQEVLLRRVYASNEVDKYVLVTNLSGEQQFGELLTWQPFKITLTDRYSLKVLSLAPAGTADIRYDSEGLVERRAQELNRGPSEEKSDPNWRVFTMSPTNEILTMLDQSPRPKPKKPTAPNEEDESLFLRTSRTNQVVLARSVVQSLIGVFLNPQLLEYGPPLPWYAVKVGDTWQGTISTLPGTATSLAAGQKAPRNNRLDVTYRFDGLKPKDGRQAWLIHATYSSDLDLKPWLLEGVPKQVLDLNPITSANVKVKGETDFWLDSKTGEMLWCSSNGAGEVNVEAGERFVFLRHLIRLKAETVVKPVPR